MPQMAGVPLTMRALLLSLADFAATGLRPRSALSRAIVCALVIKLVVVVSMKLFFFSGDARPVIDEAAMSRIIGPAAQVSK